MKTLYELKKLEQLETLNELIALDKDELINVIYNNWIGEIISRYEEKQMCYYKMKQDIQVIYIGYYWKGVDIANKEILIGYSKNRKRKGIMQLGKTYIDKQRLMTLPECLIFIDYIDRINRMNWQHGTYEEIDELNNWMQSLVI